MPFVLNFRTAPRGGAVTKGLITQAQGTGSLLDLQVSRQVVFLLHGFNVSQGDGQTSLLDFANQLALDPDVAIVAVLWPGDSVFGPISYPFESTNADDTASSLAQFITDNLIVRPGVSFVAHSLGSRVALRSIVLLQESGYPVDQVCVMAAAVDDDSVSKPIVYRSAANNSSRIAVLYSPSDDVLRFAYPAGNLLQSFIRWTSTDNAALGFHGPRSGTLPSEFIPSNIISSGIAKARNAGHSDYLPSSSPPPTAQDLLNRKSAVEFATAVIKGGTPLYR